MYDDKERKSLTDRCGAFLFRRPKKDGDETESKFLDTSTVILNKDDYNATTYYRILQEAYGCKAAGTIANILERLNISTVRSVESWSSRMEAVTVLKQPLPKKEVLLRGTGESITVAEERE